MDEETIVKTIEETQINELPEFVITEEKPEVPEIQWLEEDEDVEQEIELVEDKSFMEKKFMVGLDLDEIMIGLSSEFLKIKNTKMESNEKYTEKLREVIKLKAATSAYVEKNRRYCSNVQYKIFNENMRIISNELEGILNKYKKLTGVIIKVEGLDQYTLDDINYQIKISDSKKQTLTRKKKEEKKEILIVNEEKIAEYKNDIQYKLRNGLYLVETKNRIGILDIVNANLINVLIQSLNNINVIILDINNLINALGWSGEIQELINILYICKKDVICVRQQSKKKEEKEYENCINISTERHDDEEIINLNAKSAGVIFSGDRYQEFAKTWLYCHEHKKLITRVNDACQTTCKLGVILKIKYEPIRVQLVSSTKTILKLNIPENILRKRNEKVTRHINTTLIKCEGLKYKVPVIKRTMQNKNNMVVSKKIYNKMDIVMVSTIDHLNIIIELANDEVKLLIKASLSKLEDIETLIMAEAQYNKLTFNVRENILRLNGVIVESNNLATLDKSIINVSGTKTDNVKVKQMKREERKYTAIILTQELSVKNIAICYHKGRAFYATIDEFLKNQIRDELTIITEEHKMDIKIPELISTEINEAYKNRQMRALNKIEGPDNIGADKYMKELLRNADYSLSMEYYTIKLLADNQVIMEDQVDIIKTVDNFSAIADMIKDKVIKESIADYHKIKYKDLIFDTVSKKFSKIETLCFLVASLLEGDRFQVNLYDENKVFIVNDSYDYDYELDAAQVNMNKQTAKSTLIDYYYKIAANAWNFALKKTLRNAIKMKKGFFYINPIIQTVYEIKNDYVPLNNTVITYNLLFATVNMWLTQENGKNMCYAITLVSPTIVENIYQMTVLTDKTQAFVVGDMRASMISMKASEYLFVIIEEIMAIDPEFMEKINNNAQLIQSILEQAIIYVSDLGLDISMELRKLVLSSVYPRRREEYLILLRNVNLSISDKKYVELTEHEDLDLYKNKNNNFIIVFKRKSLVTVKELHKYIRKIISKQKQEYKTSRISKREVINEIIVEIMANATILGEAFGLVNIMNHITIDSHTISEGRSLNNALDIILSSNEDMLQECRCDENTTYDNYSIMDNEIQILDDGSFNLTMKRRNIITRHKFNEQLKKIGEEVLIEKTLIDEELMLEQSKMKVKVENIMQLVNYEMLINIRVKGLSHTRSDAYINIHNNRMSLIENVNYNGIKEFINRLAIDVTKLVKTLIKKTYNKNIKIVLTMSDQLPSIFKKNSESWQTMKHTLKEIAQLQTQELKIDVLIPDQQLYNGIKQIRDEQIEIVQTAYKYKKQPQKGYDKKNKKEIIKREELSESKKAEPEVKTDKRDIKMESKNKTEELNLIEEIEKEKNKKNIEIIVIVIITVIIILATIWNIETNYIKITNSLVIIIATTLIFLYGVLTRVIKWLII